MSAKFAACLPVTLGYEGPYSTDRNDPGNWTGGKVGKGILKGTKAGIAASSHPNLDIKNLSDARIAQIYEVEYWDPIRGDDLPAGVDLVTFDYGVNSGISRASKALQKAARIGQDGKIGDKTVAAVRALKASTVIVGVVDARLAFLQGLSTWARYGKGWGARVGNVKARALLMAGSTVTSLYDEAAADAKKATNDNKKAASAVAGAGGTASGAAVSVAGNVGHIDWVALGALGVAAIILIGCSIILYRRSMARREMAIAVVAVAQEAA